MIGDYPHEYVVNMCHTLSNQMEIVIVTGRQEKSREATEAWLKKHEIPHSHVYMREKGDDRRDDEVKRDIYLNKIKPIYCVQAVFDDRPIVNRMWRDVKAPLFQIGDQTVDF